jgi:hypothetical protein
MYEKGDVVMVPWKKQSRAMRVYRYNGGGENFWDNKRYYDLVPLSAFTLSDIYIVEENYLRRAVLTFLGYVEAPNGGQVQKR